MIYIINYNSLNTASIYSRPTSIDSLPSSYNFDMKVFPSHAAKSEKWQFSFRSPKSVILPTTISNFDNPILIGVFRLSPLFFFPAWYGGHRLVQKKEKRKKCLKGVCPSP